MNRRARNVTVASALLLFTLAAPGRARGQQWHVEAHAGKLRYDASPAPVGSLGLVLGLRYDDARSWFGISGGVPLGSEDPLWGAVDAWKRFAVGHGRFLAGVDLSGQGFLQRHEARERSGLLGGTTSSNVYGFGAAGQVMPVLAYEGSRVRLEARSGLSHYYRALGEEDLGRTVRASDLRLTVGPSRSLAFTTELRHFGADEGDYAYGGVTGHFLHPRGSVWASVGRWFSGDAEGIPWSAGASVAVGERAALSVSARRSVIDPLYLSVPRTSWGLGLSYRLGAAPTAPAPVPASYVHGRATILLPASESPNRPLIAGDFNDWRPEPMIRAGDDWSYTVALAPGAYNYAFVRADGEWFVPESVPGRKDDGMGGWVAVLVVR